MANYSLSAIKPGVEMSTRSFSRSIPHPVTLLSVSDGVNENIATMSWVAAVSRKPPLLMVSVSPKRYSHDLMLRAGEFAIIVLTDARKNLATLAGTHSGKESNKWDMEEFKNLKQQAKQVKAPVLKHCGVVLECRLVNHVPSGDHTIMIGEVIHASGKSETPPLILSDHKYFKLGSFLEKYP
jgi:flavin reductase (DIM6/NTAB) family NADH-FMN oxidoreductase RutF